jgi:hypothetical protein
MCFHIFIIAIALTASSCSFAPHSQKNLSNSVSNMSSQTDTYIERITLIAREEKRVPLGIPQNNERNIGFASFFSNLFL